ncbi:carbohydrate-binding protein [Microbacterium marinilacus]|uniref:Chitin-binding type-3 domain-containing protein n=1 Tax=Microbacterium marinilacus TaxID=415209 RepID=A0ABP7BID6_9MICO|nr:carbohydrate-binding protein [Microbacterium marinilacus]
MSLFPVADTGRRRRAPLLAVPVALGALLLSPTLVAAASPNPATSGPEPIAVEREAAGGETPVDPAAPIDLTVLQFNLWGKTTSADVLAELGADVVFVEEAQQGARALASDLGFEYHSTGGSAGVISRYPIVETDVLQTPGTQGGWMKAVIQVGATEIAAYGGHLEYRYYANYLPRGYAGDVRGADFPSEWQGWDRLAAPVTDVDALLAANEASGRPAAAALLVEDMESERAAGRIAVAGMDMNEASVFDWDERTADLYDHNGTAVPWQTTSILDEAGLVDAYRSTYPDPVSHPGMTWPADTPNVPVSSLAWAPEADERDRIDYIFYAPDERLSLESTRIVGPQGDIVRGERALPVTSDPIYTPEAAWTSDHKALQADFVVCGEACLEASEPEAPAWVAGRVYDHGDVVSHDGAVYVAQWWTTEVPGASTTGSWMERGEPVACAEGDVRAWTTSQVYTGGERVAFDGQVFEAKWWTRDQRPGDPWGPWSATGAC